MGEASSSAPTLSSRYVLRDVRRTRPDLPLPMTIPSEPPMEALAALTELAATSPALAAVLVRCRNRVAAVPTKRGRGRPPKNPPPTPAPAQAASPETVDRLIARRSADASRERSARLRELLASPSPNSPSGTAEGDSVNRQLFEPASAAAAASGDARDRRCDVASPLQSTQAVALGRHASLPAGQRLRHRSISRLHAVVIPLRIRDGTTLEPGETPLVLLPLGGNPTYCNGRRLCSAEQALEEQACGVSSPMPPDRGDPIMTLLPMQRLRVGDWLSFLEPCASSAEQVLRVDGPFATAEAAAVAKLPVFEVVAVPGDVPSSGVAVADGVSDASKLNDA